MKPLLLFLVPLLAGAAEFHAGLAAVKITPPGPARMSGYASRHQPSAGVAHDLFVKALALEDRGGRFLLLTFDLVSLPPALSRDVAARVESAHRIPRHRLLLNCSHTHGGPVLVATGWSLPEVGESDYPAVERYTAWLAEQAARAADLAVRDLAPARLSLAHASAGFAVNRRELTPKGMRIGVNPNGPVDHDVPVLAVRAPDGRLRGVLFAYACHATTLGGQNLLLTGDYPGVAQAAIEQRHPGAVALFLQLCGADQNPAPRNTMELVERHGRTLADAVEGALARPGRRLRPPLRAALETTELPFPDYPRQRFEARLADANATRARHARLMLDRIDAGRPIRAIPYPVQAVRFGRDATLIALSGEVVVDYALRARRELGGREELIVAGYSNQTLCYIPSLRVLREGGYEADDSLIYDGMPGPFAETVEERVFAAIRAALHKVGR
jgi:hypothetical protein